MSFKKFKSNSFCVGGSQRTATANIYADITSKSSKNLVGHCSFCNRKKSMSVSDNATEAEELGNFFKNLGKRARSSEKDGKTVQKYPGRSLEIRVNVGTAFASRSPKRASSSSPEAIGFYHTGKKFYLGNFVCFSTIQMQQETTKLYPSAPLENRNDDLEQRIKN